MPSFGILLKQVNFEVLKLSKQATTFSVNETMKMAARTGENLHVNFSTSASHPYMYMYIQI